MPHGKIDQVVLLLRFDCSENQRPSCPSSIPKVLEKKTADNRRRTKQSCNRSIHQYACAVSCERKPQTRRQIRILKANRTAWPSHIQTDRKKHFAFLIPVLTRAHPVFVTNH